MRNPINYLRRLYQGLRRVGDLDFRTRSWERINFALARGAAGAGLRRIDETDPRSWEFSGFSQNCEDGIIDHLLSRAKRQNRYFIEIGASDGLENNTSWLALVRRFSGLMIDGDPARTQQCRQFIGALNLGLQTVAMRVTRETAAEALRLAVHKDPDVFVLDIDGLDYYVAEALFAAGLRPKIVVVEYNSALGPDASLTVEYKSDFDYWSAHPSRLYYGVSINGWCRLLGRLGYQFITVEQNGVNAFFADRAEFDPDFLKNIRGINFQENFAQRLQHGSDWQGQRERIKDCKFVEIDS